MESARDSTTGAAGADAAGEVPVDDVPPLEADIAAAISEAVSACGEAARRGAGAFARVVSAGCVGAV
jgi:hypothetical protein